MANDKNAVFEANSKMEKQLFTWKSDNPSAKTINVVMITLSIIAILAMVTLFLTGLVVVEISNKIADIEQGADFIKIGAILMAVTVWIMPLRNIILAFNMKNWAKAKDINLAKELYGTTAFLRKEKYIWLAIAADKENKYSLFKKYVSLILFQTIGKALFIIPFFLVIGFVSEARILLDIRFEVSDIFSFVFEEYMLYVAIMIISIVFDIVAMVIGGAFRKKCAEYIAVAGKPTENENKTVEEVEGEQVDSQTSKDKTLEEKIAELKSLREKGMITEIQYNEAVKKLLNQI